MIVIGTETYDEIEFAGKIIDEAVNDRLAFQRAQLPKGKTVDDSLEECDDCGNEIPDGRRAALPGVRLCVECQSYNEKKRATA